VVKGGDAARERHCASQWEHQDHENGAVVRPSRRVLCLAAVCLTFAGCGGSDVSTGLDEDPEDPGGEMPTETPSFAADVNTLFVNRGCTAGNCHGGGAGDLSLTSTASTSYADLVGVASDAEPSFLRVEPGDAQNSYLVIKLEGRQSSGGRMPLGGAALSASEIATIRAWIEAGAAND
jgi:hypothetical protein